MKLWTTVDITRMPDVQRNGLTNPTYEEMIFALEPELIAQTALDFEGELAFIEVDFPDEEIDELFAYCIGSVGDDLTNMEMSFQYDLEAGLSRKEIRAREEFLEKVGEIQSATENLNLLGYACLAVEVPPEMIRVLDPLTMLEAVASDDKETIAQAVKEAPSTPIKEFGAAFWAFIAAILTAIFATGTISEGLEMAYGIRNLVERSKEARERRRERAAEESEEEREERPKRRKTKKKRRRKASLSGPYQSIQIRAVPTPVGNMRYVLLPVPGEPGPRGPVQVHVQAGGEADYMHIGDAPDEYAGDQMAKQAIDEAWRRMVI
jgi:hypothetical protein